MPSNGDDRPPDPDEQISWMKQIALAVGGSGIVTLMHAAQPIGVLLALVGLAAAGLTLSLDYDERREDRLVRIATLVALAIERVEHARAEGRQAVVGQSLVLGGGERGWN